MGEARSSAEEWRRHWGLVLAASVGFGFYSVPLASAGLFIEPLEKEFGWDKTEVTSGLSAAAIVLAVLSPFFGVLIDRWGARPIAIPGVVVTGAAICAFALASGSLTQWLALWIIYAVAALSVKATVWTAAVASVFQSGRGLAIGLTLSGTALAQTLIPPIGNALIENFGWRAAYVWLACGWGAVSLLLCLWFLRDAHDLERARSKESSAAAPDAEPLTGLTVAEAWRNSALWRLAVSSFVIMLLTMAIQVHQFPLLTEAGISRASAAWMVSLAGIAAILGKLVTGWLMDRFDPNLVGGLTLASSAVAFLLLLEPFRTTTLIVLSMVINGYAAGTKMQIAGYLTAQYGGMRNYGKIYGAMTSVIALGSGLGPVVGGAIYEIAGSYSLLLLIGIGGCLLSGGLILGLGRRPEWARHDWRPEPAG